jgi:DNA-binding MarR family transcriptional regulator
MASSPAAPATDAQSLDAPELGVTDNLLASIHVMSRLIDRAFQSRISSRFDLSLAEWRVLLTLAGRPSATAAEIIEIWAMEKMAVSRAVRRLERMGRIAREQNSGDRRSYSLSLTASGRQVYEDILPTANARYREIFSQLSRDDLQSLRTTLDGLVEHTANLAE